MSERVDREVALGDKVLFQTDRTTQAGDLLTMCIQIVGLKKRKKERVLRIRAKEHADKHWNLLKLSEEELVEKYVKKQTCPVCTKHFDLFRRPR